ncbi:MAG: family 20 glycosylhydrolase [Clostridia bacterium]|nr:family 20 glycosylhydrolase [Clostridia bacterium]
MLNLNFINVNEQIAAGLYEIAPQLNITLGEDGIPVTARVGERLFVSRERDGIVIEYRKPVEFFRALSQLGSLAEGESICEEGKFDTLCYMADLSRNAVLSVKGCKRMLRYLALMGYDSMMLYTEDTYEITEYPNFGRMRGRFSQAELRELDDYAYALGIELIPCIQALAHLNAIFRWQGLSNLRDTGDILLVGEEKTYDLVRCMIKTCASCFRSRRIHLGMDEAHDLGRGAYLTRNGFEKSSDIMLKHLARVNEMCREQGLEPIIWSDMFFRMQFGGRYYVKEGEISPEVVEKVPEGLGLVYWDYYTKEADMLAHMIHCHKQFDRPVYFAGGAWKWTGFTPHNISSNATADAQLSVCLEKGVSNIIVTAWGDDGAEASQFSVLPNLLYWAEKGYANEGAVERRSRECFGIDYEAFLKLDLPDRLPGIDEINRPRMHATNPSKYLLYNDPIEGLLNAHIKEGVAEVYAAHAETLLAKSGDENFGVLFDTLGKLCRVLARKCDLSIRIRNAYHSDDRATLGAIAEEEIGVIIADLEAFTEAFRKQWYSECKPHGFSVQDIRLGGLRERLLSARARLRAYLAGEIEQIEELDEPIRTVAGNDYNGNPEYTSFNSWAKSATACVISHSF